MQSILAEIKQGGTQLNDKWVSYHDIPCHIIAAWMATRLSHLYTVAWLIETNQHSVAWDGKHTWDLRYGLLFKDYQYPAADVPAPTTIWPCTYSPKFYEPYYIDLAQQSPTTLTEMRYDVEQRVKGQI